MKNHIFFKIQVAVIAKQLKIEKNGLHNPVLTLFNDMKYYLIQVDQNSDGISGFLISL